MSTAFVLLAVAEPSVAVCQLQNGASAIVSDEKQIITCTDNGDSNKPYKITTRNTVLENNGTMTGNPNNGNQYQTADATTCIGVLGTDSPHDKVLVKNNGSILWDKALNLGTSDFVSAVLLNKPANNNNTSITSVGFENEKNAKVSITMAESPDKSPVAAVMAYADNGTATFKNAGTIDLQVPVVKSSDTPNTEPSQPKAVYGYYSQAMMATVVLFVSMLLREAFRQKEWKFCQPGKTEALLKTQAVSMLPQIMPAHGGYGLRQMGKLPLRTLGKLV
ncbi:hypothetical protein ACIPL5_004584 [Escherichia coli]|nr:hypothetical protein [Escherichia coli]EHL9141675.1 hypothetical protein [Escherichia coli]ELV5841295.1 hypothetical protein [Escherichia coli]